MRFACYPSWDQLPESAQALFAQASHDSMFLSQPWFENLVDHGLDDGWSLRLACVIDGDRMLAMLPLMSRDGEHLHALGHRYTSLFSLLLAEDDRHEETIACLAQGLSQLPVISVRLAPVADDDSRLRWLQRAMESHAFTATRHFRFYNWGHRLRGGSFAQYMAGRPSKVRNTIARKQRKLAREHGYDIRLYVAEDLAAGIADYHAVYDASWKARELFAALVDGMVTRLAAHGWLRLAVLYIAGRPAAAQLWFVVHGKASIFRLAYDESWKQYSPGSILIAYLMEYAIDTDRVEELDFLTGNDAYKGDWMSERRERTELCFARPRPPGNRARRLIDAVRGWLQHRGTASKARH
jgi:CelD/BcsL family acetyltransferase involved in cellulose biosynthesis